MRLHKAGIGKLDLREDAIGEAGAFAIDLRPGITGHLQGSDRLRSSNPTGEQVNVHAIPFGPNAARRSTRVIRTSTVTSRPRLAKRPRLTKGVHRPVGPSRAAP